MSDIAATLERSTSSLAAAIETLPVAVRQAIHLSETETTATLEIGAHNGVVELTLAIENLPTELIIENHADCLRLSLAAASAATQYTKIRIVCAPRTQVELMLKDRSTALTLSLNVEIKRAARFDFFSAVFGKAHDLELEALLDAAAVAHFYGLTELSQNDHANLSLHVKHREGKNHSEQHFYSYASDEAQIRFTGKITVLPGAGGSVAHQLHRGIMRTEGARIQAQPFLNISHDDVKCTHGSTVGFVDEDAKQYLMARGISPADAEQLLVDSSQARFYAALPDEAARKFFDYTTGTI
ncbi:MAG: SufD family Fe-S cluster assembly protein [Spirochaetes bacterium]|nr:SufD family Fe-S cluster assembly protein [Spirochaetota bacterium]